DIWRGSNIVEEELFDGDEPLFDNLHYDIPNPHRRRVIPLHNGA
uniref:Uncharacterized protein n=1 Tax=Panagrolaimus sp. PS1159 TaxID=55785 RepID=A0AC35EX10_9BILA